MFGTASTPFYNYRLTALNRCKKVLLKAIVQPSTHHCLVIGRHTLSHTGQARAFRHTGGRRNLVTGRPGSGCRPLRALNLAQTLLQSRPSALQRLAGRNTQRCPLLRDDFTARLPSRFSLAFPVLARFLG
jgi:hypothetical protein